jgi:hypothetical protein
MVMVMKVLIAGLAMVLAACSSDEGSDSSGALQAPMLTDIEPMEGALHLTWMNMQADADSVEAERKMDTGEFEAAFSVPGSVDNRMDTAATDDMPYTYRLRAKKGTLYSDYSNELTANPHDVP